MEKLQGCLMKKIKKFHWECLKIDVGEYYKLNARQRKGVHLTEFENLFSSSKNLVYRMEIIEKCFEEKAYNIIHFLLDKCLLKNVELHMISLSSKLADLSLEDGGLEDMPNNTVIDKPEILDLIFEKSFKKVGNQDVLLIDIFETMFNKKKRVINQY